MIWYKKVNIKGWRVGTNFIVNQFAIYLMKKHCRKYDFKATYMIFFFTRQHFITKKNHLNIQVIC